MTNWIQYYCRWCWKLSQDKPCFQRRGVIQNWWGPQSHQYLNPNLNGELELLMWWPEIMVIVNQDIIPYCISPEVLGISGHIWSACIRGMSLYQVDHLEDELKKLESFKDCQDQRVEKCKPDLAKFLYGVICQCLSRHSKRPSSRQVRPIADHRAIS